MGRETRARAEEKLQEMDQCIAYHGKYPNLSLLLILFFEFKQMSLAQTCQTSRDFLCLKNMISLTLAILICFVYFFILNNEI